MRGCAHGIRRVSFLALIVVFFVALPASALAAPVASTDGVSGLGDHQATLEGRVNPGGTALASCRFEYGTSTAYGATAPCVPGAGALGSGNLDVAVSALTEPLEPGLTYHYRLLVTSNASETSEGKDRTFTTTGTSPCPNIERRLEQGIRAILLPDCMALEQVSPAQKFNAYARNPQVSADGERVSFRSNAALAGAPNLVDVLGDLYVATRTGSGWATAPTRPPAIFPKGWGSFGAANSLSPDFSSWFQIVSTQAQFGLGIGQAYRGGLGGVFAPLSPLLVPHGAEGAQGLSAIVGNASLEGAAADHSRLYFQPRGAGAATITYLPGDPQQPAGSEFDRNAYVAKLDSEGQPSLALMARDAQGKVWGGRCGARLAGVGRGTVGESDRNQGAVSADGRRAFISARPGQAEGANCNPGANKLRILIRLEGEQGVFIGPLYSSQCNRVAPACKGEGEADGDDRYQGASVDGAKLYFTTNRQLASSDLDGDNAECSRQSAVAGCDLYLYDSSQPQGQELIQVSAGESGGGHAAGSEAKVYDGTVAISGDGSHAYFAAEGVLTTEEGPGGKGADEFPASTPKLYLYERDEAHPNGRIAFVGGLDPGDGGAPGLWGREGTFRNQAYPVPATGKDEQGNEVGGDGHILLFQSKAALSANDADGSQLDVFRYDAESEELSCVSCRPGGPDGEPTAVAERRVFNASGTDFAEEGRWASEDGRTAVFKTAEGMVPSDDNGILDSYLWREGQLARLPGTSAGSDNVGQLRDVPVLSHDGAVVAFTSRVALLPSDGDTATDTYVARIGGGFAQPQPEEVCAPDAGAGCQGTAPAPPPPPRAPFSGPGNPKQSQKPCPKGKRKVRRGGKTRCVKPQRRQKRSHHRQDKRDRANAERRSTR